MFQIDDIEKEWTWTRKFDLFFSRMMPVCFNDLPSTVRVAYDNLESGGYLELQDMSLPARSDDGTLDPNSFLSQWCDLCIKAGQNRERPRFPVTGYKQYLADAGFVEIIEVQMKWPTNTWPGDAKFEELGAWAYANIAGGLEGLPLAHFTRGLGWSEAKDACLLREREEGSEGLLRYTPTGLCKLPPPPRTMEEGERQC